MPRSVRHVAAARRDLKQIRAHLVERDAEQAADRLLRRIAHVLTLLADAPEIGRGRPELREGLRSVPVGRYIVFYDFDDAAVRLVRVIHSARDIAPQLFDE